MKTAISLPDETFQRATQHASDLGISRSEFFARAASRYLQELEVGELSTQINQALAAVGTADESNQVAVAVSRGVLNDHGDDW